MRPEKIKPHCRPGRRRVLAEEKIATFSQAPRFIVYNPTIMNPIRIKLLLGVAAVLFVMLVWHFISGWGLVTVHVADQPLSKVIRSIERQGGIKIVTNADLTAPVSMDVDRVPPVEAVDVLASWFDGNWSVSYAAGPTKPDVIAAVSALQEGGRRGGGDSDFARFGGGRGGPGDWGGGGGDTVIDVRKVAWKVSPSDKPELQSYLDQLSQKTGLSIIVPQTWNPPVATPPKGGEAADAIRSLVKSAKGQYEEVFVLRVQTEQVADNGPGGPVGGGDRGPRTDGGFGGGPGGGGRGNFHPEWAQEREDARLALLPVAEREQVKRDRDQMRATFEKIRALPEAERRAAVEKIMEDPAVQERMLQRMMTNDAKRSPEKRAERFRQYLERKQQAKQAKSSN